MIPAGKVVRTATLTTNDPANRVVKILFNLTIERDEEIEGFRALSTELQSLRKEVHMLRRGI